MIPKIYYQVNGRIIFNELLARYESYTTGAPVEFHLHDAEYDQLDWTQEPVESFDELMLRHAQRLRNQYERVVLLWSGGTDSHTIYNTFVRNNLHIDEIVIFHNDRYEPWNSTEYIRWMQTNHPDATTKKTARFDKTSRKSVVSRAFPTHARSFPSARSSCDLRTADERKREDAQADALRLRDFKTPQSNPVLVQDRTSRKASGQHQRPRYRDRPLKRIPPPGRNGQKEPR